MSNTSGSGAQPPGYYRDHHGTMRWWDGTRFTEHTMAGNGAASNGSSSTTKILAVVGVVVALLAGLGIGLASGSGNGSTATETITITPDPLPAQTVTVAPNDAATGEPASEETTGATEAPAEPAPSKYNAVQVGDTGGFTLVSDVSLRADSLGDFEGSFDMRNDTNGPLTDYFKLIVLKSNRIVVEIPCGDYETVAAGRIKTMACITGDDYVEGNYEFEIEYDGD